MRASIFGQAMLFLIGSLVLFVRTSYAADEKVDVATIERIKVEALQHSQVMDTASWLTDVYGPRLTGSPITRAAADWAVTTMQSWGLSNVHLEFWGPAAASILPGNRWDAQDRGWTNEKFTFRATTPYPFVINAVPSVWSPSTNGCISGPAIRCDVHSLADLRARFAGKLNRAFLLMDAPRKTQPHFKPQAERMTDADLEALAAGTPLPIPDFGVFERRYNVLEDAAARQWLASEGVSALVFTAAGDGGTIFMSGQGSFTFRNKMATDQMPVVKVAAESYGRIVRILEKKLPVTLELDMQNTFYDRPDLFNVIAEIPGTDPKLKDEIVMIGAQLDSWTYGTGATDNAAGAAVTMETMRILKALELHPRRTIRAALWTGHEQGTIGSGAYVRQHFRDGTAENAATKPEYEKLSAFFMSGGYGKVRGIHQMENAAVGPIFDAWMGPFKELGMKTTTILGTGLSDHSTFHVVGLPAFRFTYDPLELQTRTHHSSADVYERLQPADMKFNAAVLASFAWQAAQRDEKLPRATTEQ